MARRKRSDATFSLFPFLSVLVCAMGVMIVIITGQNLVAMGGTQDQYMEIAGSVEGKEAVYVECQENGVLIHPDRIEVSLETLKGPGPSSFHQLLDRLEQQPKERYLVLLVRPEGIKSYERCFFMARFERKLEMGKDAIPSGGNIVLTKDGKPLFTKKRSK